MRKLAAAFCVVAVVAVTSVSAAEYKTPLSMDPLWVGTTAPDRGHVVAEITDSSGRTVDDWTVDELELLVDGEAVDATFGAWSDDDIAERTIVLLDLSDGADIGALGEDAAAETGEDRYERSPEAEGNEGVDHRTVRRRMAHRSCQDHEIDRDTEQCEAGDEKAGHGAGLERDLKPRPQALACRLRGPHIGAHGYKHANIASNT